MPDTAPMADALGWISVDLAARVAGIARSDMQRIAAEFAKGKARDPWFGATLAVRTEKVLGRKHRDIAIASLPPFLCEALSTNRFRFRLAAEQARPGAELGPADFMLLHRTAQSGVADADFVNANAGFLCQGSPLLHASRERFDLVMDNFYGFGFRDHALPGVSPDYRDFLERSRRYLGMSDRYYACALVELAGVERPDHLDGGGFVKVADYLMQLGLPWTLPDRDVMDRETVGELHEACYQLGIPYTEHSLIVTRVGGGAIRTRDLDVPGWLRTRAAYLKAGYRKREPAPRVSGMPGEPGAVTQPQANLIWRFYCDRTERPSAADLDRHCGGSLAGLTQAGARAIIDNLLEPVVALRLATVEPHATAEPVAD